MAKIPFTKMSGCGNDFILVDNRKAVVPKDAGAWVARICPRRFGVGADGLILVEKARGADFRMRFFNADGSEAEMCGNGARCVARFAHQLGIAPRRMSFDTVAGRIGAEIVGPNHVRITMTNPKRLETDIRVTAGGRPRTVHFVDTGVPHLVVWVKNLDRAPVVRVGRLLRFQRRFQPAGTNVNFAKVTGPQSVGIRTYERGVEDETWACGTGAVASAVIAFALGSVSDQPVTIQTRGGVLEVGFQRRGRGYRQTYLQGPAEVVYSGHLP